MTVDVGSIEEFPEGRASVVMAGRTEVGIVRWSGAVYAISAICSHQGGPLCQGVLAARLTARRPGEMLPDDAAPVIACPWHGWEFDLASGEAIWDPAVRIRTFPVRVTNGRVIVDTQTRRGQ